MQPISLRHFRFARYQGFLFRKYFDAHAASRAAHFRAHGLLVFCCSALLAKIMSSGSSGFEERFEFEAFDHVSPARNHFHVNQAAEYRQNFESEF